MTEARRERRAEVSRGHPAEGEPPGWPDTPQDDAAHAAHVPRATPTPQRRKYDPLKNMLIDAAVLMLPPLLKLGAEALMRWLQNSRDPDDDGAAGPRSTGP